MREHISDAITRRAADGITRRGSLMTLGGAGMAAMFGGSVTADARKNKEKNKKKKKEDPFKLCAPQVAQCQTSDHRAERERGATPVLRCLRHL